MYSPPTLYSFWGTIVYCTIVLENKSKKHLWTTNYLCNLIHVFDIWFRNKMVSPPKTIPFQRSSKLNKVHLVRFNPNRIGSWCYVLYIVQIPFLFSVPLLLNVWKTSHSINSILTSFQCIHSFTYHFLHKSAVCRLTLNSFRDAPMCHSIGNIIFPPFIDHV